MLTVRDELLLVLGTAVVVTTSFALADGDPAPLQVTAGLLVMVAALAIPLVLARRRRPSEPRSQRPDRPWAEVPSWQRRRVWVVAVCSGLLLVLLLPLLVLGVVSGADPVAAVPLVLIVVLAPSATWWVWRQVRRPDALEREIEAIPRSTRSRRTVLGTAAGAVMIVVAGLSHEVLPDPLALPGVFVVIVALGLVAVAVGRRFFSASN